jgi:hypothetical protein
VVCVIFVVCFDVLVVIEKMILSFFFSSFH